ncbi:MAG: AEC family transporter [Puniceicoccales bacterium]|jgi:predicted permease|nr:AEC family transporter [Puniceicoccales bacterium]
MTGSSASVFNAVMPVLAIAGAGFALRKWNIVGTETQTGLMRIALWLFLPCLVLDRVPHNAALASGFLAAWTLGAGFLSIAAGLVVAWMAAPLLGLRHGVERRTFAYCASIYNYGYVAIPLCQVLIGAEAVGVMLLFNAGVELGIWSVGLMVLTGRFSKETWRRLANPMTVGSLFALGLNVSGTSSLMPEWSRALFAMLGACAIPVGILMVGMAMPVLLREGAWRGGWRVALGACVLRNGVIPLVMLAPVAWVALPSPLGAILALQAAMPAGIFSIVVAQHFGGDSRLALRVALWSSLCGVVSLPLWLDLLARWMSAH